MLRSVEWKENTTKSIKERENMEFTKDQLLIIEEALRTARDNACDEEYYEELSEVLSVVRLANNFNMQVNELSE